MIDGSINPAVASYIEDSLAAAKADGASALVIQLDTPGGLLSSAEKIVKDLLAAPVPVIVYVAPSGASAASAGTFITAAANITFARSIAQQRGRNEDWIEQAVRHSIAIGEREALAKNVIDIVAPDLRNLLTQASGRKVQVAGKQITLALADAAVRLVRMTPGQHLLNTLADPNIVYLLMMAGLIGLYFEFAHPGVIFPGVAGAICLLLALASFQVLPINLTGLLLIFLGVGLLISEAFVTSYGILGLGGVSAFVIGSLFLIDTSKTDLRVNRDIIYGAAAALTLIILGIGFIVARERRRRPTTGLEALIGEVGEVREPIAPGAPGKVFVHGEIWRATSSDALEPGARARIKAVNGLELQAAIFILSGLKVLNEYERAVVFRLGRLTPYRGPGVVFVIPVLERMARIDLRTVTLDIPPQDVITKDNVTVKVSAVLYFRVVDPSRAVTEVANYLFATMQLAQTTLRSVGGQTELDELLSQRDKLNARIQEIVDSQTEPWGVKVTLVELKNIDLPQDMQRAIAAQAEAERERRAKVIAAEGEFQAAQRLADAADIMGKSPITLQLRYLQTLKEIATDHNSTTVFPMPIDLFEPFRAFAKIAANAEDKPKT